MELGLDTLGSTPLGSADVQVRAPGYGPCSPFVTTDQLLARDDCGSLGASDDQLSKAVGVASEVMWAATGRQFSGGCRVTLRPCCSSYLRDIPAWAWREWGGAAGVAYGGGYGWTPEIIGGNWYNIAYGDTSCGCLAYDCGGQIARLDLGYYPVTEVAVTIDGLPLSGSAFRIDDWRYLTRTDGNLWPQANSAVLPDGVGVWTVDLVWGYAPPVSVVEATLDLAAELLKGDCGKDCRLPLGRVATMQRHGVNYSFADVWTAVGEGRTGIYSIDVCIKAINPVGLAEAPRVISPDRPRPHPRIMTAPSGVTPPPPAPDDAWLIEWASDPDTIIFGTITRDANEIISSATVRWPDGVMGTFTTLAATVDGVLSYAVTYGAQTVTQPLMTRDANGAIIARPAIVIS